jgi:hypothetical protein
MLDNFASLSLAIAIAAAVLFGATALEPLARWIVRRRRARW